MSEKRNIEKLFRDKLKNFEASPSDDLWDKIEQDLTELAKPTPWWRKRVGWIWISGALVMGIGLAAIYFLQDENVIIAEKPKLDKVESVQLPTNSQEPVKKNELDKKTTKNVQQSELVTGSFTSSSDNEIKSNASDKNVPTKAGEQIDETSSKTNSSNKQKISFNQRIADTEKSLLSTEKVEANSFTPTNSEENASTISSSTPTSSTESTTVLTSEKEKETSYTTRKESKNELPTIPVRKATLPQGFSKPHLISKSFLAEPEAENEKQATAFRWFVSAYGGPSMVFRRFESNHSLMHNHKQQAEKGMISYDWGIEAGMQKGKWEFSIGFQYERLGERYQYEGMKEVHDTSITQHQHPQDPTVWIYDTAVTVYHNKVSHNSANTYNYFTIPINVGYQFSIGSKLTLTPTLTSGINILSSAQTAWLDPESLDPVLHNSEEHQDAFRAVNFSNRLQIGLYYQLNKNFQLLIRPEGTILWQSVFNNDEFLNHRPYAFDANVGIRYFIK